MSKVPPDVEAFLRVLIRRFAAGERDEAFAVWAAAMASLLLEVRGQDHLY